MDEVPVGQRLYLWNVTANRGDNSGRKKTMDHSQQDPALSINLPGHKEAWEMVLGNLRTEMSRALYETWVQPLRPVSYQNHVFTVGAYNPYGKAWVEERLASRIEQILSRLYNEPVTFSVAVSNSFYKGQALNAKDAPALVPGAIEKSAKSGRTVAAVKEGMDIPAKSASTAAEKNDLTAEPSSRKMMLQRAYGSERARLIQPERGMFVTNYLFANWLPLLGHSAFAVILAARSLCYWNPMTGEMRNVIETEMGELADRAAVSVRTVKDVLNNELVMRYFLRYRVRRVMTSNGVRTAGISMQVRMDDPLTPTDQVQSGLLEEEEWYLAEFSGEKE
jgi:hypothetical protein